MKTILLACLCLLALPAAAQGLVSKVPFPGCNAIIIKTKHNAKQVIASVGQSALSQGFESETYDASRPLFRTKAAFWGKTGIPEQYAFSGVSDDTSAVAIYGWRGNHISYSRTPFAGEKIVYRPEKALDKVYWSMLMRWVTALAPYTTEVYYTVY